MTWRRFQALLKVNLEARLKPSRTWANILSKVKDPSCLSGLLLMGLILLSASSYPQQRVEGKVLDATDGNGIPFAHIVPLGQQKKGTQSDLNGNFVLSVPEDVRSLVVSSVGFEKDTLAIADTDRRLRITLQRKSIEKKSIEIRADRVPAVEIIKKCIERRKAHDPLEADAFRYRSYNRSIYSDRSIAFDSSWTPENEVVDESPDSTTKLKIPDSIHAFIMETVTERNYAKGRFDKKTVLGSRASGFEEAPFTGVASEFQEISFYRDHVELLGETYRSPISKGAWNKYQFRLRNELVDGRDSLYFIQFGPRPGREHQALKGILLIGSGSYALRGIRAHPAQQGPNPMRVEQRYQERNGRWFPVKMNFELRLPAFDMVFNGRSRIEELHMGIEALGEIGRKDLGIEKLDGYEERDSSFWEKQRPVSLSEKDSNTYQVLDSLNEAHDLDRKLEMLKRTMMGYFPLGPFDIRLNEIYRYNAFEGHRVGLGLETNERLSPYFRVGGYWGYGTEDHRSKYGADLEFRPSGDREWRIGVFFRQDLREPGRTWDRRFDRFFGGRPLEPRGQRGLFIERMLLSEEMGFRFRTARPRYLDLGLGLRSSQESLLFSSPLLQERPQDRELLLKETSFRFRFAYGERSMKNAGRKLSLGTPYPVIQGGVVKGWKESGGDRAYTRLIGRIEHDLQWRGLGEGRIRLAFQRSYGDPPISRLFYPPGTYSEELPLLVPFSFNTAGPYEFLHSRSLYAFYQQTLLRLRLHNEYSRPLIRMRHKFGWGDRRGLSASYPSKVPSTMEHGFYESGLVLKDLLRAEQEFYAYGLGVSFAYRYGAYADPDPFENFAYGIEFSFEF